MSEHTPEGGYQATVNAYALTESKNGDEQYVVEFRLPSGDLVTARYGFKTDKQTDFTFAQLRALGWKGDDLAAVALDTETKHSIAVKHEQGNDGKTYVSASVNTGGVGRFALAPEKAKSFADRMRERVRAFDATGKSEVVGAARTRSTTARTPAASAPRTAARPAYGAPPPDDDFGPMDY